MNKKGMTLIEVIIALAILGILSVIVLSFFSVSLLGIFRFGDFTEKVFIDQELLELDISNDVSGNPATIQFSFEGEDSPISIDGEEVIEGGLEVFLPD
ncbi:MAG: prepilin-type N-terminal cleavage/methylation domain-containing protein [Clostridiales bacterium]|nr:prepilin-type N-terminal cleavage/methylation domain-containing protein [Clostridiales bacterium]